MKKKYSIKNTTILDALKIAREAMKERRAYCEQWEYKYGAEWDNEDGYIQSVIEKLEEPIKPYGSFLSPAHLEEIK